MDGIRDYHLKEFEIEPDLVVEVPQVTTVLGAFSDSIKGYSLMSTNDSGLRIAISKRDDNTVRVYNVPRQDRKKFQITNIKYRKEDRWANCIKAILFEVASAGFALSGMNITIKGPSAAGDNSSFASSVAAGMLLALKRLYGIEMDANEMIKLALRSNRFSSSYQLRLRDLITLFTAQKGHLIFFDLESYEYELVKYPFDDESGVTSYIIDTSLPSYVLNPDVDEFLQEMQVAAAILKTSLKNGPKLRDVVEKDIRQIPQFRTEQQKGKIMYLIEESERAKLAYDAIKNGDKDSFGKILTQQQNDVSYKAELSSPEIDWLVKRGLELEGVLGLAQVYVGIPGTLLTLVDSNIEFPYTSRLEEYTRIFGFKAEVRRYIPSGGLRYLENDEDITCK